MVRDVKKASGQLCKIGFCWSLGRGQSGTSFQTSCLFLGRKAGVESLHHQSWPKRALPFPPAHTVPAVTPEVKWAADRHISLPGKVWAFFLAWACLWEWFEENQLIPPCAVPTWCIKRGFQPLRQTRWHLSQEQNLFLELFVKLQSALEISTQSLPVHKRSPLMRPVCLQMDRHFLFKGNKTQWEADKALC